MFWRDECAIYIQQIRPANIKILWAQRCLDHHLYRRHPRSLRNIWEMFDRRSTGHRQAGGAGPPHQAGKVLPTT